MTVADFAVEGAVRLEFGGAVSTYFGHFVVAIPREADAGRFGAARFPYVSGATSEGELSSALTLEQDIGSIMSG